MKQITILISKAGISILLLLLTIGTVPVSAQQTNLNEVLQQARDNGLQEAELEVLQERATSRGVEETQLIEMLQSAVDMSEQNLPPELVLDKIMEGFSKNIPPQRIMPVLQQMRDVGSQAVAVVDPWMAREEVRQFSEQRGISSESFRNELVKASTRSMMQNVSAENVGDMLNRIADEATTDENIAPSDIISATGILPNLPQSVLDSNTGGQFIVRAMKGGFRANDLQRLPEAVAQAQQRSELPAASVVEGVSRQLHDGTPAKEILQNLFDGNVGGGPPGQNPKGLNNNGNSKNGGN